MRYIAKVLSIKKGDEEQCLVILTGSPAIPRSQSKLTGKAGHPPGCRAREKARAAHLVPDMGSGLAARVVGVGVAHAVPSALDLALAGVRAAPSALALAALDRVGPGAYPTSFWRCAP